MKWIQKWNISVIDRAIKLMGRKRFMFLAAIFMFCAVDIICTGVYAIGVRGVVNALTRQDASGLLRSLFYIAMQCVLWWCYAPLACWLCDVASKSTMRDFKTRLVDVLTHLPMRHHDQMSKGEILSIITGDTALLGEMYDGKFSLVLFRSTNGLGGLVIMAVLDWRFALVVLALGSASIWVTTHFAGRMERAGQKQQTRIAKSSTDVYELIKATKAIRLLRAQTSVLGKLNDDVQQEADARFDTECIAARMDAVVVGISALTYAAILFVGALFVRLGLSDWGAVIALTGMKVTTDMLFIDASRCMAALQANVAGIKRALALLDAETESTRPTHSVIRPEQYAVSLHHISFRYVDDAPVLSDCSLSFPKREVIALTGGNGSGKSTIIKLLLGLYAPDEGMIVYHGHEDATLANIRAKCAYVPQEPILLRGTIYDNIALGRPGASMDAVVRAAQSAGAHSFICALPQGYHTEILDDGRSLSGGQLQRIAIARALLKNSEIMLLDEITSALDAQTAEQVLSTVLALSKQKTVVMISHAQNVQSLAGTVISIG